MLCKDIIRNIEERYPKSYAMTWDNVGLLVGSDSVEVTRIYVALDLTDQVIEDAQALGAQMIVTHHPLIFSPMKQVNNQDFIGRRVMKLIESGIAYYAMHTNYDVLGMADLAAERIKLQDAQVLEVTSEVGFHWDALHKENPGQEGIGRIGYLPDQWTLGVCARYIKERFGLESVKVFGDENAILHKAAIAPGSGKSMVGISLEKGADVLITGDMDHHEGIDAVAQGMAIIDAGHYGLEHIFMEDIKSFLEQQIPDLHIDVAPIQHPFHIL